MSSDADKAPDPVPAGVPTAPGAGKAAEAGARPPKPPSPPKPLGAPPLVPPPPAAAGARQPPPAPGKPPPPIALPPAFAAPPPPAIAAPPPPAIAAPPPPAIAAPARPAPPLAPIAPPAPAAPAPTAPSIPKVDTEPLERASFTSLAAAARTSPSISNPPAERHSRSTMEFLFELDAPSGPPSAELDLRSMPDVRAAIAAIEANTAPAEGARAEAEPKTERDSLEIPVEEDIRETGHEQVEPVHDEPLPVHALPHTLPRIALRGVPTAKTAEEQHEQRKRRTITRIATCRDAFRVLGFLDLRDSDRKEVARLLMGLDQALDLKGPSVAKEPSTALANATKDELDRMERLLSPIEERLLALDDLVPNDVFNARANAGKMTAKALARYARLLVSRRIQAGQRRDRFELIATLLLTRRNEAGVRLLVGEERAKQALELMIGGLPFKAKEQEAEEAVAYLSDALARLDTFKTQEEFFASELFLDVHGYKVSMREQLLNADFVYLSVAINVKMQLMVDQWVASVERLHKANQLKQEGSPREQIERRLREQEESVADIFRVKAKPAPAPAVRAEPRRKDDPKAAARPEKKKKKKRERMELDGRLVRYLVAALVILGSGVYLVLDLGVVNLSAPTDVATAELGQMSSVLARGVIRDGVFEGQVQAGAWLALNAQQRRAEAERIAKALAAQKIEAGRVALHRTVVIEIRSGLVARVETDSAPK